MCYVLCLCRIEININTAFDYCTRLKNLLSFIIGRKTKQLIVDQWNINVTGRQRNYYAGVRKFPRFTPDDATGNDDSRA